MNLEQDWIDFLADLFTSRGWEAFGREVVDNLYDDPDKPDLIVSQRGSTGIVELKLHRSDEIPKVLLRNARESVIRMARRHGAGEAFLVIPLLRQGSRTIEDIDDGPLLEIIDIGVLDMETRNNPRLRARLLDLLRALEVGAEVQPSRAIVTESSIKGSEAPLPPSNEGARLADALDAIAPGNVDSADKIYEKLCVEALKLLFGEDLTGWKSQSSIDMGFQRVDLIARIQPEKSPFWLTLVADFHARYVVFEFKNYAGKISEDQIYSTERYLYATALRSVAIIIARNGIKESAERAVRGALREQGKLLLCLSQAEFSAMLRGFDEGNDPLKSCSRSGMSC